MRWLKRWLVLGSFPLLSSCSSQPVEGLLRSLTSTIPQSAHQGGSPDLAFELFASSEVCGGARIQDCTGQAVVKNAAGRAQVVAVWGDLQATNRDPQCSGVGQCGTVVVKLDGKFQAFLYNQYGGDLNTSLIWEMPDYVYVDGITITAPSSERSWGGRGSWSLQTKVGSPRMQVKIGADLAKFEGEGRQTTYRFEPVDVVLLPSTVKRSSRPAAPPSVGFGIGDGLIPAACQFVENGRTRGEEACKLAQTASTFSIIWNDGLVEKYLKLTPTVFKDDLGDRLAVRSNRQGQVISLAYDNGNRVLIRY